jgi:hypothetical protein
LKHNAILLSRFGKKHARALGLSSQHPVQAHSFHAVGRVGPTGRVNVEIVAELMQKMEVRLDPKDEDSETFTFRGGTTVVLTEEGKVRYAIQKSLGKDNAKNERLRRQREYYRETEEAMAMATYISRTGRKDQPMRFNLIHRGY